MITHLLKALGIGIIVALCVIGTLTVYDKYVERIPFISGNLEIEKFRNKPVLKLYIVYDEVSDTKCTIYSFKSRKEVIEAIYSISTDDCYLTITEYKPARIPKNVKKETKNN